VFESLNNGLLTSTAVVVCFSLGGRKVLVDGLDQHVVVAVPSLPTYGSMPASARCSL